MQDVSQSWMNEAQELDWEDHLDVLPENIKNDILVGKEGRVRQRRLDVPPMALTQDILWHLLTDDVNAAITAQYKRYGRIEHPDAAATGKAVSTVLPPLVPGRPYHARQTAWPEQDRLIHDAFHGAMQHLHPFLEFATADHRRQWALDHAALGLHAADLDNSEAAARPALLRMLTRPSLF
jgi:hypothetical protein